MIELNQIILADCMNIMKDIPDKYFELAIVDPPYGIGADNFSNGSNLVRKEKGYPAESSSNRLKKNRLNQGSGKLKNRILNVSNCSWDINPPDKEYFDELFRISKNQIICGGNYFDLSPTRGVVCWDKQQPWENFSQIELIWTSFDKPAKIFRLSNTGGKNDEKKIHPTQKPIALYRWLLQNYANPGDKIIDTHSGSGSLACACHLEKFEFLAIEKDPDYHAASVKRLEELRSQGVLF